MSQSLPPADPGRRRFLRTGLAGAVALTTLASTTVMLNGCSTAPATGYRLLRTHHIPVLVAVIPAVLAGVAAATEPATVQALVRSIDDFVFHTSRANHKQFLQLLDLLGGSLGRRFAAGLAPDWNEASVAEVQAFLVRWRDSRVGLFRLGYGGLVQAVVMNWYLQPAAWPAIGYEPPRHIPA